MSYLVLARKYRPRTFSEVTGQEVVTGTLRGAIEEGRVAHAYLFCGPRGTGKTTTARLFAKALNCEQGPTADPCGTCDRCLAAEAGNEADVIEIDAASHTGVDNVRDLRDQAAYAPLRARHKIYIIDEVHMLSKAAFNALLKTLEEPPPHVKFLFATTEPHKVLDTILSRCQVLKLSALSEEAIVHRLDEVFSLEGVQAEPGVTAAIARRARGGMRDALSLADQLLALVGDAPTVADTARLSAGTDREGLERLVAALVEGDRPAALRELASSGGGESELVDALLGHLRSCLLVAHCGQDTPLAEGTPEARVALGRTAERLGADRIELWMEELLHAREQIRLLPGQARHALELCLLRLARGEAQVPLAELLERLQALESRLATGAPPAAPASRQAPASAPAPGPASAPAPAPSSGPAPSPRPAPANPDPARAATAPARARSAFEGTVRSSQTEAWSRFLEELGARAGALATVLREQGRLVELGQQRAVVRFDRLRQADRPLIRDARNLKLCARVMSELLGREVEIRLEDGSELRPGAQDPFTKTVAETFQGRVED
jgi:DNA polymerase-3 subunit gamma/tau